MSVFLVKDMKKTRHTFSDQKTVHIYNEDDADQKKLVGDKVEALKKKYKKLKTIHFITKVEVPEDFLPTGVGGLSRGLCRRSMDDVLASEQMPSKSSKKPRVK